MNTNIKYIYRTVSLYVILVFVQIDKSTHIKICTILNAMNNFLTAKTS